MTDTEPHIFSRADIERQRGELRGLREKHAIEIVFSGLADRMLQAWGPSNEGVNRTFLHEGTELLPYRTDMKTLPADRHDVVFEDVRLAAENTGCEPEAVETIDLGRRITLTTTLPSYVFSILRRDTPTDRARVVGCSYVIGCDIAQGWITPVDGITDEDVGLINRQLREVDSLRISRELTMLSETTLVERNPLVIRND
jgi:hypothetical protein